MSSDMLAHEFRVNEIVNARLQDVRQRNLNRIIEAGRPSRLSRMRAGAGAMLITAGQRLQVSPGATRIAIEPRTELSQMKT